MTESQLPPLLMLCGGLGTRLGELSKATPKSLVLINGEPFLAHQLRLLSRQGFKKVVFCVGHLSEAIIEFVGTGEAFNIEAFFSPDGETLLGTGGAVKKALNIVASDTFGLIYGDSYLDVPVEPIYKKFQQSGALALMTVYHNASLIEPSNMLFRVGKIIAYDKAAPASEMQHVDYGLSFFRTRSFDSFAAYSKFDLADVMQSLINQQQMAGYEVSERYHEVGSATGIRELEQHLLRCPPR